MLLALLLVMVGIGVFSYFKFFKLHSINPKGKLVVVTGAAGGIGHQTVKDLVGMGAEVIACDINEQKLKDLYDSLSRGNGSPAVVHPVKVDVTSLEDIDNLANYIKTNFYEKGKQLFGLVNNAGIGPQTTSALVDKSEKEVLTMININLLAAHRLTKALYPYMVRLQKDVSQPESFIGGSIVNISSVLATSFPGFISFYSITKAAIATYSDALRRELRHKKVRVSYIQPGAIQTPIWSPPPVIGPTESEFSLESKRVSDAQARLDKLHKQPPTVVSSRITKCLFTHRNGGYDCIERMIAEENWLKYLGYEFLPLIPTWLNEWYFRQMDKPWFLLG